MGDDLKKVQAGDRLKIPARAYNAFVDSANTIQARQHGIIAQAAPELPEPTIIRVRNDSGNDRDRFDILGLDEPLVTPFDDANGFAAQVAMVGNTPDETYTGRFGILLEPIETGSVGRAVVSGVCPAKIKKPTDADPATKFPFADVDPSECGWLMASGSGSAQILWMANEAEEDGTFRAYVRLGAAGLLKWGKVALDWEEADGNTVTVYACDSAGNHVSPDYTEVRVCGPKNDMGWPQVDYVRLKIDDVIAYVEFVEEGRLKGLAVSVEHGGTCTAPTWIFQDDVGRDAVESEWWKREYPTYTKDGLAVPMLAAYPHEFTPDFPNLAVAPVVAKIDSAGQLSTINNCDDWPVQRLLSDINGKPTKVVPSLLDWPGTEPDPNLTGEMVQAARADHTHEVGLDGDNVWIEIRTKATEVGVKEVAHISDPARMGLYDPIYSITYASNTVEVVSRVFEVDAAGHITGTQFITRSSTGTGMDELVKVDAADPVADYLGVKIVGDGTWISTPVVGAQVKVQHGGPGAITNTVTFFQDISRSGETFTWMLGTAEWDGKGHWVQSVESADSSHYLSFEGDAWLVPTGDLAGPNYSLIYAHSDPQEYNYPIDPCDTLYTTFQDSVWNVGFNAEPVRCDAKGHVINDVSPGYAIEHLLPLVKKTVVFDIRWDEYGELQMKTVDLWIPVWENESDWITIPYSLPLTLTTASPMKTISASG